MMSFFSSELQLLMSWLCYTSFLTKKQFFFVFLSSKTVNLGFSQFPNIFVADWPFWSFSAILILFNVDTSDIYIWVVILTLLGRGGAESARTFLRWLFLHEKRGLEVQNFVTFPNSLWTFRKSKKIFLVFHSVLRWSRSCGLIQPPLLSSNIQKPRSIRVKKDGLVDTGTFF